MRRLIIIAACFMGLAACASSSPEQTQASAIPDTASDTAPAGAEAANGDEAVLEVVEVPVVAQTAEVPKTSQRDELVCHREKQLGSHRLVKVCRYRSEIEAEREATQRTIREAQRRSPKTVE